MFVLRVRVAGVSKLLKTIGMVGLKSNLEVRLLVFRLNCKFQLI